MKRREFLTTIERAGLGVAAGALLTAGARRGPGRLGTRQGGWPGWKDRGRTSLPPGHVHPGIGAAF